MATVIDTLLVELGLDASKFNAAQKKATEDLKKFEDTATRSNKSTQETTDKLAESFAGVGKSILALGGISLGMSSFKAFIGQIKDNNIGLARSSTILGQSARELDAWSKVSKSVNGGAEDMTQTFRGLQSSITALKMGQGNADFLTALSMIGLSGKAWKDGKVNVLDLSDALVKFKEQYGIAETRNIAERLGLNDTAFILMMKGREELKKLYDDMYDLSGASEQSAKAWMKVNEAFTKASAAFEGVVGSGLAAYLDKVTNSLYDIANVMNGKDSIVSLLTWAFNGQDPMRGSVTLTPESRARIAAGETAGTGGASGDKRLPRNLRNNNPGNIEYGPYAKSKGAIGSDGRFAIFPTPQAGEKAMSDLLSSYRSRGYNTIASIIGRWSPASDNAAGNTAAYISDVSRRTGIDPNQRLSDAQMFAVQHAMALHEGGIGAATNASGGMASAGGTQVQTTINTLNVNTQATDADGMARDAYKALSDHAFIGAGLAGAQ